MKAFVSIILFFCLMVFSISCVNRNESQISLEPQEPLKSIIDTFVQKYYHEQYHVYELYIDRLDPFTSNILLYAGDVSLTDEEKTNYMYESFLQIEKKNVRIRVYSGFERYFKKLDNNSKYNKESQEVRNGRYLAIKDSSGFFYKYEIDAGYPFVSFPLENSDETFSNPLIE